MSAMSLDEQAIFEVARKIEAGAAREAYLRQVCGNDAAIGQRVRALLEALEGSGSFLEAPALAVVATTDDPISERPGTLIGSYKLLEQIGEGGFGVVFMAEQTEPVRRRVALKVLKPGMDTRQVVARFEAERQALALMDHPNIARVLDGGQTSNGRPYFVMDLVKGLPITDYCDQAQLAPRVRLELFVHLCQAVQHAHQKGIIHRDLKPSNVLVTMQDGKPVVKVIDFGIAKALGQQLTDKTLFTGFAQMVGTPLYMSPEQAALSNVDVDTRSDVYSLAVLLYELLTGTTPFTKERLQQAAYDEMRRIIREEEPPRPSARISTLGQASITVSAQRKSDPKRLSQLCRGELDWLVMKALEKDRNRRYESASAFAADVQRYLADEPVQACPPSAWYRFHKFARRRKAGLAFAGMILAFLLVLGGGIGWVVGDRSAREKVREREAEEALDRAAELVEQGQWRDATAWAQRAKVVLDGGKARPRFYQRLDEIQADLKMVERLAEIRIQLSNVRDEFFDSQSVDVESARAFREYGIDVEAIGVQEAASALRGRRIWLELVLALDEWADVRSDLKPLEKSWKHLLAVAQAADSDELRNQLRRALETRPRNRAALTRMAASEQLVNLPAPTLVLLGRYLYQSGKAETAVAVLRQAQRRFPNDFWINHWLGFYLMKSPHWQEALPFLLTAQALRPESPGARINLSWALAKKGEHAWDLAVCQEAVRIKPDYATAWLRLGGAHINLGQQDKALACYSRAIDLKPDHATAWHDRGNVHTRLGQHDQALADYSKAVELKPDLAEAWDGRGVVHGKLGQQDKALADHSKAIRLKRDYPEAWYNRGVVYSNLGQLKKALADYTEAIRLKPDYTSAWLSRAATHAKLGQLDNALADSGKAIELEPDVAEAWLNRANCHTGLRQFDKAFTDYSKAIELKPDYAEAWYNRGNYYFELNQFASAIDDYSRAIKYKPDFAKAWHNRGMCYHRRDEDDKALIDFSRATELKPDYLDAWHKRGIAHHYLKQYDKAVVANSRVIELRPDYADAWENRGLAHRKLGKLQDALNDFQQYRKLTHDSPRALNNLAWFFAACPDARLRDPKQAVELAKKAVALLPEEGNYWNTLGVAHYRAGDYKAAVTALEKSVQLKSGGNSTDWFFLAMSRWKLDEHDRARKAYDRAVRWTEKHALQDEDQRRFGDEAAELLGIDKDQSSGAGN
jgi:tetratricopeptide (TPR) repeat protein